MQQTEEKAISFVRGELTGECLPAYMDFHVETLPWADEQELARSGEIVKSSRSRKVLHIVREVGGVVRDLYVKCYSFTDMARKLKYMLRTSRARSEWDAIRAVRATGVATPRPVLVADRRTGTLSGESYLVTEAVVDAPSAKAVIDGLEGAEKRTFLRHLGQLLGRLHERGVYHDDLKATHILLESGRAPENGDLDGVVLIDLHNAQTGRAPSIKQRGTNLAQVIRSLPLPRCSDQFRLLFGMVGAGPEKRDARRRLHRAALAALAKRQG